MQETLIRPLGWADPLEMATHFSIFVWKTPWIKEPGGLQSVHGSQRVGHDLATEHSCMTQMCSFKVTSHKDSIKSLARVLFHLSREGKAKGHFIPSLILISLLNNDDEFTPWQQWTEGWLETGVNLGVWGTAGASHTWLSIFIARLRLSAARGAWLAVDLMPERASSLRTWHGRRAQPTSSKSKRKQWQWRSPSRVWLFVIPWIIVGQAPKHALKNPILSTE